ncbi:Sugar transferase involved in LPS biosynthesis (colanic, teichoic acid) [Eubacterium ruminantium]|uniref:Sugar transferase involved in LPS biosynthesis (Colanic, teichoic acid) n=1 Tax=Eubacterium ruminantium TaxID=42322 RepID=A0A1T4LRW6_9FIRM|nr:sugar transferase [Eubacterium ruminantium]SCW40251.1 Sugar transferase involved in LPS biosynthesis (colanic, teichoic acid) [Eubacterium ruminantium]SDM39984.1 Sugar transferase involved in LPS biosynthesis (colanic, teichoic acid) [Eubacterium ruminantium]SJZ57268.1 Sugar transferase involved in LPS biosynthesis (colanic, teichoic acid) [Eubacterium ruminantium]
MYLFFKRFFDLISSLVLFIIISPLFLLLWVLVRIKHGKPAFYKQIRSGKGMKSFTIIKFRSMTEEKDINGEYLPDEQRVTSFGKFLRSSSLDELPELLSIIKGDMSVIGPRPLPISYDDYYTEREKLRFNVRGGLIPPEVLYNNVQPTWDEQLEYEAYYGENISLKLDFQIIMAVFKGLLKRYKNDYGEYVRESLNVERKEMKK